MDPLFAEAIFEPAEATTLMDAYNRTVVEVEVEYVLDDQAKSKLGKIILAIGHNRVLSGGGLASDEDAESIASIAAARFIKLRAE
jgi:hypothetical protein